MILLFPEFLTIVFAVFLLSSLLVGPLSNIKRGKMSKTRRKIIMIKTERKRNIESKEKKKTK